MEGDILETWTILTSEFDDRRRLFDQLTHWKILC